MKRPVPRNHNEPSQPLLSEFAGDAAMTELIEFFTSELQDRMKAMHAAWVVGDTEQLRRIAHQLKGAAGGYGFPSITESAAELETILQAEEAEVSAIREQMEALIELCRRASMKQSS